MDFLKAHKRRSRWSEALYIALNIGLAVVLLFIVRTTQSPWLAVAVMLLSKWRALAVRPRFWFANLIANMVDIIVGVSTVVLLYAADGVLWLQLLVTALYVIWLLFIKPRSRRLYIAIQAGVAVFAGITALSIVMYAWDSLFFVAAMWVIGYAAARHVISSYDEPHTTLYSLIVGLIFAEFGWIAHHWLMAYQIEGFGDIQFSQLALLSTLFCLVAERAYASYHRHGAIRKADVIPSVLLTAALMIVLFGFAVMYGGDAL